MTGVIPDLIEFPQPLRNCVDIASWPSWSDNSQSRHSAAAHRIPRQPDGRLDAVSHAANVNCGPTVQAPRSTVSSTPSKLNAWPECPGAKLAPLRTVP